MKVTRVPVVESDTILKDLKAIELETSADKFWHHKNGYNDVKSMFRNAIGIAQELRAVHVDTGVAEGTELPIGSKVYVIEKLESIARCMGYEITVKQA